LSVFPDAVFMRSVAYVCNALVTGKSAFSFRRAGWMKWSDIWPYLLGSVPLAICGGFIRLDTRWYLFILGFTLCFSAVWMIIGLSYSPKWNVFNKTPFKISAGAIIGFISGLVGIGGGIFLAPLLYLSKDQNPKTIAGITSTFILINSIAGACAYWLASGISLHLSVSWKLFLAVILGSVLGTFFTINNKWKNYLRIITAILIGIVGIRLILR
ncbi:MAG: sulfite exporter TauE/SafE family protein, partial [Flavobacteriales bacterium]